MHQLSVVVCEESLLVYSVTCCGACWTSGVEAKQRQTSTRLGGRDVNVNALGVQAIQAIQAAVVCTAPAAFLRHTGAIATSPNIALSTIVTESIYAMSKSASCK